MKKFNLDEYLKNPERKVVTGTRRNVRIVCTDRNGKCPIVALIEDEDKDNPEEVRTYTKDGNWSISGEEAPFDLFFAPERHEGWINIFTDKKFHYTPHARICKSREEAEKQGKGFSDYAATIKIEWED